MICSSKTQVVYPINKALNLKGKDVLKPEDIELYQNDFITEHYEDSRADIIYKVVNSEKVKNGDVFIHIEHQSKKDTTINNRILECKHQIIRNAIKNNKRMKIPKVYSIVIYIGEGEKRNVKTIGSFEKRKGRTIQFGCDYWKKEGIQIWREKTELKMG